MEVKKHIPTLTISVKHYQFLLDRVKALKAQRNILRAVAIVLAIIVGIQAGYIEHISDTSAPMQAVQQMDGEAYGTDQNE